MSLRRAIVPVLLTVALAGCAAPSSSTSGSRSQSDPLASTQGRSAAPKATTAGKKSDKGWVLQSVAYKDDGLGTFGGTARVTNANGESKSAVFTITLGGGGSSPVASLQGSAQDVAAGKTVTVQLISQDKYKAGKYAVDFQTDTSY